MRAVLQRVLSAKVTVDNAVISSIGRGLCILIGISSEDTTEDLEYVVRKCLNLRLFDDESGTKHWARSVMDAEYEVLCVSQFTLYAKTVKNKPDFHTAMASGPSKEMYSTLLQCMRQMYKENRVKDGAFGAFMHVNIVNEGPVTVEIDSKQKDR